MYPFIGCKLHASKIHKPLLGAVLYKCYGIVGGIFFATYIQCKVRWFLVLDRRSPLEPLNIASSRTRTSRNERWSKPKISIFEVFIRPLPKPMCPPTSSRCSFLLQSSKVSYSLWCGSRLKRRTVSDPPNRSRGRSGNCRVGKRGK